MTPITLTGEWHVSEVEFWGQYPYLNQSNTDLKDEQRMRSWPYVIAYADKHAPTDH